MQRRCSRERVLTRASRDHLSRPKAELWTREVDRESHGASHVKTFIGKLTREAIAYMDEQINTWLADNPDVEVKFVTVVQGDIIGRTREPSLLVSVWV